MATVKVRTRRDGTPTYRVVWRDGGSRDGLWESETFATKRDAARFRRDVDLAGQRWPERWVRGVGYQLGDAEPAEPEVPVPSFVVFGQQYVRDLSGITPATRHRYDRQVLLLGQQLRAVLRAEPTIANIGEVHVRRWVNARRRPAPGRRRITLSPTVVAVLRRATDGKDFHDLVFTAPQGAPLNQATFYEDRWKKAVRLAQRQGLRAAPRFHDLRHTHAAWLISAGVPLPVIQQWLGHESITTTVDIYGGLLLQAHDAADAAIDAALGGRSVPAPSPIAPAQCAGGGGRSTGTPSATGTDHRAGAVS